jgi:Zn-dependent peptidase ImmA (M78 family)
MQIRSDVPYIPDSELEAAANTLLDRYGREVELVRSLPAPVDQIAEILLNLRFDWTEIADDDDCPTLAAIAPASRTIYLNERRKALFDSYFGCREFSVAHELGHHELHLVTGELEQLALSDVPVPVCLCRRRLNDIDRRELQAERFASFLLLPSHLLLPAIDGRDLLQWPTLYHLRDAFHVSISALTYRLQGLGKIYVKDKTLYPSEAVANGQLSLL